MSKNNQFQLCSKIFPKKAIAYWQTNVKHLRHASQNGRIDVLGSIGSANDHYAVVFGICGQTVPQCHELCLYCARAFMVVVLSRSQKRV